MKPPVCKLTRTNNQENLKKLRITANNRVLVIIHGIRIRQLSRILSNNHTIRGFYSNTSRILINNRNICMSPVPMLPL